MTEYTAPSEDEPIMILLKDQKYVVQFGKAITYGVISRMIHPDLLQKLAVSDVDINNVMAKQAVLFNELLYVLHTLRVSEACAHRGDVVHAKSYYSIFSAENPKLLSKTKAFESYVNSLTGLSTKEGHEHRA